jgi:hypothetical protein
MNNSSFELLFMQDQLQLGDCTSDQSTLQGPSCHRLPGRVSASRQVTDLQYSKARTRNTIALPGYPPCQVLHALAVEEVMGAGVVVECVPGESKERSGLS